MNRSHINNPGTQKSYVRQILNNFSYVLISRKLLSKPRGSRGPERGG